MYDIAIIGAGPAGLSAALYALRAGKTVVIFEGNAIGGILNVIEKIENYPGFKSVSGTELAKKMSAQIMRFKPTVVKSFVVSVLETESSSDSKPELKESSGSPKDKKTPPPKSGRAFTVYTNSADYTARSVIYAGGAVRAPLPAAERFKGSGVSYCAICDGYFYRGKTVAVLGSGFTAREDAEYLIPLCKKVYIIGDIDIDGAETIGDKVVELIGQDSGADAGALAAVKLKSGRVLDIEGLFIALGLKDSVGVLTGVLGDTPMREGKVKDRIYIAGDAGAEFKQIVWAAASGAKAASDAVREL